MDSQKISEIINLMNLIINGVNVTEHKYSSLASETLIFIQEKLDCLENENNIDNNINNIEECDENFVINENYFNSNKIPYDYKNVIKISNYIKAHPGYNFKSVQSKFKKLTRAMYFKIKKFSNNNNIGFESSKHKIIKERLFEKFKEYREKSYKVSDKLLRSWAIQIAKEENFPKFKAGTFFIYKFKKEYRISGRKINKFLTEKCIQKEDDIQNIINKFRKNFQENIFEKFNQESILNSDQTNFKYELSPKRTLAFKGEKSIKIKIQNKNSTTHSYTVMPTISMGGRCFGNFSFTYLANFPCLINFIKLKMELDTNHF